jgi:hypothetical protein
MNRAQAIMRSGARLDASAPQIERLKIGDISEGLAKINRWTGSTVAPYSVAQHSLLVAEDMYREDGAQAALYGLLHDAHEALIGDITVTTEQALDLILPGAAGAIATLKDGIDRMIHLRLDLDWPMPAPIRNGFAISHARVAASEARDLLIGCDDLCTGETLKRKIVPLGWTRADADWQAMLSRYAALCGLRLNLE